MEERNILILGDIHGEFELLRKSIDKKQISDVIIIQVGDFGIGFYDKHKDQHKLHTLNNFLIERNIEMYTIRGNHDDPSYFTGTFELSNIKLIPDYYTLETMNDTILFIGGAISIDRTQRTLNKTYWCDEIPIYKEELLSLIKKPTIVVTHTSPSFAYPTHKDGISYWMLNDLKLNNDLDYERSVFTKIWDFLIANQKQPLHWVYGHFHRTYTQTFENTKFRVIDELEFYSIN